MKTTDVLFKEVWEKSFDGMRIVDDSAVIVLVNQALCEMTHMKKEQLIGKDASVIYAVQYQANIQQKLCERINLRTVAPHLERKYTLWDGSEAWFELSNSYLEIPGEPVKLLSIFRDMTEPRRAFEALAESEERYHAISDYMLDLIGQTDTEGTIQYASGSHATVLNYDPDELKERSLFDLLYPEDAERLKIVLGVIRTTKQATRS